MVVTVGNALLKGPVLVESVSEASAAQVARGLWLKAVSVGRALVGPWLGGLTRGGWTQIVWKR